MQRRVQRVRAPATSTPDAPPPPHPQVRDAVARCGAAADEWRRSGFAQRRRLLRIILKFIVENQEEICRWAGGGCKGWGALVRLHCA